MEGILSNGERVTIHVDTKQKKITTAYPEKKYDPAKAPEAKDKEKEKTGDSESKDNDQPDSPQ